MKKDKKLINVSNIYICVYDYDQYGLFSKINWSTRYGNPNFYDAGSIYIGIDTDFIGMKETHRGTKEMNYWRSIGAKMRLNRKYYITNIDIWNEISFDELRANLFKEGKIPSYQVGVAAWDDIYMVLSYTSDYFNLSKMRAIKAKNY